MNHTRSIQEIFNIVIESGCYGEHQYYKSDNKQYVYDDERDWSEDVRDYMCGALKVAFLRELISYDEFEYVKAEIQKYLKPLNLGYLSAALKDAGLPNDFNAKLAIYKDWANRPKLEC